MILRHALTIAKGDRTHARMARTICPATHSSRRSQSSERQVGLWCGLASPIAAEILAGAGFDWIVIDGEHAPNDITTLLPQLQAMRGGTAEPVFRVPWNDMVIIKRALDVGARSLLIPFVQNAEEARKAVAATRYPPLGIRGVSVAPRANDYGRMQNYHRNAHLDTCVLVQLETKDALKEIEAVAAVEGVDGIFIGPSDLAAAFGHLGNPKQPDGAGGHQGSRRSAFAQPANPRAFLPAMPTTPRRCLRWATTSPRSAATLACWRAPRRPPRRGSRRPSEAQISKPAGCWPHPGGWTVRR